MTLPLTITFLRLERTGDLESSARDMGSRLFRLNGRIAACHIALEGKLDEHGDLRQYEVKIHLSIPGAQIHADSREGHSEARDAFRAAYEDARRQLNRVQRHGAITG